VKRAYIPALLATISLIGTVLVGGCGNRVMISSILQNPNKYMDREVNVAGDVTKTYGINLIIAQAGAYQVDDGSGKIWIITKTGVPREGARVGLKGTVQGGVTLGRDTYGAVIQEIERRTK
jgi:hypothetical protein